MVLGSVEELKMSDDWEGWRKTEIGGWLRRAGWLDDEEFAKIIIWAGFIAQSCSLEVIGIRSGF